MMTFVQKTFQGLKLALDKIIKLISEFPQQVDY